MAVEAAENRRGGELIGDEVRHSISSSFQVHSKFPTPYEHLGWWGGWETQENTKRFLAKDDDFVVTDFVRHHQADHRMVGVLGLYVVAMGISSAVETYPLFCKREIEGRDELKERSIRHVKDIMEPVLRTLLDQDNYVPYHACEALYNIAKAVRGEIIGYLNQAFDALLKLSVDSDSSVQGSANRLDSLLKKIAIEKETFRCPKRMEKLLPLLREHMHVTNTYARQFLMGWIEVLDRVPDNEIPRYKPVFLDGLFDMLGDCNNETRQKASSILTVFLQEITKTSRL